MALDITDKGLKADYVAAAAGPTAAQATLSAGAFVDSIATFNLSGDAGAALFMRLDFAGGGVTQYDVQVSARYDGESFVNFVVPVPLLTTSNKLNEQTTLHSYPSAIAAIVYDIIQFASGRFSGEVRVQVKATGAPVAGDRARFWLKSY